MIVFIKGPPESGKSTLAERIVDALALDPVEWNIPEDLLRRAQSQMGRWLDLSGDYFGCCRHLDMDRVVAWLQIEKWDELPRAPRWEPDADRDAMLAWRRQVMQEIYGGRLLPELFRLTCRLLESQRHAVLEGAVLGSRFSDSVLTRMLRGRFLDRPQLHVALDRRPGSDDEGATEVLINGHCLSLEEAAGALSRQPDGTVTVNPKIGWTWAGAPASASTADTGALVLAAGEASKE